MATIQQEIMSIAEAQGYEGKSSGTIAEAINALGSVMGDYELPAATATTLGGIKVGDGLAVESDGTLSASGGGGAEPLIVHLGYNSSGNYAMDKTFAEIGEAALAGKLVFLVDTTGGGAASIYPLTQYNGEGTDPTVVKFALFFGVRSTSGDSVTSIEAYRLNKSNTVKYITKTL